MIILCPGSYPLVCQIYITKGNQYICKDLGGAICDVPELSSSYKDASSLSPDKSVCVVSDDTDVNTILLSRTLQMEGTLYFRQGTSKGHGTQYHDVSSLANFLGEHCCKNLPGFHAITGCDFIYPFFRRTKHQSFSMMINLKKKAVHIPSPTWHTWKRRSKFQWKNRFYFTYNL